MLGAAGRATQAATALLALLWANAVWPTSAHEPCEFVRARSHASRSGPQATQRDFRCVPARSGELSGAAALLYGGAIDLNRAEPALLEVLPRIGQARALAIAAERCRAPFESVADVERVAGIGPRTLDEIRPFVKIGSPVGSAESRLLCGEPKAAAWSVARPQSRELGSSEDPSAKPSERSPR